MNRKGRNNLQSQIIAGILVICMLVICVSTFVKLSRTDFDYNSKEQVSVIERKFELEKSLADGKYDGTDSSYENKDDGWKQISGEGLKYGTLNILEIVPDRRYGYVGYMQEGCEPIANDVNWRGYIMDAMVNNAPGSNDAYQEQFWFNGNFGEINLGDSSRIINRELGKYNGYFLKVESGTGVYGLNQVTYDANDCVKNVIMQSKFAKSSNYSHSGFDYVWVETPSVTEEKGPKTTKNQMKSLAKDDKIYVYNYKKCKYKNSNLLQNLFYSAENNDVRVFTRTPSELAGEPDLVRNVDLIFVLGNAETACFKSFDTYTHMYGEGATAGTYSSENDIPTDQMLKIYNRVVNDKNLAIVYSHVLWGVSMNLNIQKLMYMLYMVETPDNYDDKSVTGSGREIFNNFLKSKDSAIFAQLIEHQDNTDIYSDIHVSDIVYIDENNGNMVVNGDYSGKTFTVPDSVNISQQNRSTSKWDYGGKVRNDFTWPTAFEDDWLMKWAQGYGDFWVKVESWMRDGNGNFYDWVKYDGSMIADGTEYIYQKNTSNNTSFPLYKFFIDKYKFETEPGLGHFENQYIHNDTGRTFKYGSDGELGKIADSFKEIIPNKITEPEQITADGSKKRIVYMTMNIRNGNSVNTEIEGANKNIYINSYEFDNGTIGNNFVIDFEMKTTHPVKSITATVGSKDYLFNYVGPPNLETSQTDDPKDMEKYLTYTSSDGGALTLINVGKDSKIKEDFNVSSDIYVYDGKISGISVEYFNNTNTKVKVEAVTNFVVEKEQEGKPAEYLSCDDSITIVKNTFFDLN